MRVRLGLVRVGERKEENREEKSQIFSGGIFLVFIFINYSNKQ